MLFLVTIDCLLCLVWSGSLDGPTEGDSNPIIETAGSVMFFVVVPP